MGYVALKCPSFANRDSEAVFSEIFSCSIFDKLRIEVLCGGESQKPGNFKERTTYTLPYFHKKRYNLRDSIFVNYSNKI